VKKCSAANLIKNKIKIEVPDFTKMPEMKDHPRHIQQFFNV